MTGAAPLPSRTRGRPSAALVAAILLTALPSAAAAQSRIQSGEHVGFSRLALVFERETAWSATRVDGGYLVRFSPPPGPIDLREVFDLIPRERITDVQQDEMDGSLFIASTCDCHLDAFDAGRRVIALDVKDGPDPAALPSPDSQAALPADLTIRSTSAPTSASSLTAIRRSTVRSGSGRAEGRRFDGRDEQTSSSLLPESLSAGAVPEQRGPGAALETRLREDMRRAAAAGLVDLSDDATSITAPAGGPDARASRPHAAPSTNIELRSALEPAGRSPDANAGQPPCPSPDRFDFLSGRSVPDILAAMPTLKANIVDAAGRVGKEGTRRLIEAYLALGFGAEAVALGSMAPIPARSAAIYRSLGLILDGGGDDDPTVWAGLQRCPSSAALWAYLGHSPDEETSATDIRALQQAFFGLPAHLRQQIGPDLVTRLRSRGRSAAAAAIAANLSVLTAAQSPARQAGAGRSGPAIPTGARLAPGAGSQRVDALIERALTRMRARRLPAREDIVLAEALARELSGTESGAQLADLVALGHLADGEPGHAANALLQPRGGRDTAWEEALASAAAASIAALSDIDLFGLAIQERGPDLLVLLSDRQRIYVSMRLTDLGFPTLASEMLGGIDADGQEARRALARAALATQDPAKALALVAGDDTPASAMLRGDALSALGEHARAAMAYADAQDADRAARAAWLSGQREAILRHGTDRQRATASALLQGESVRSPAPSRPQGTAGGDSPSSPPPAQETTPSLSGARALAAESASLRDTLEQVLSDRPSSAP